MSFDPGFLPCLHPFLVAVRRGEPYQVSELTRWAAYWLLARWQDYDRCTYSARWWSSSFPLIHSLIRYSLMNQFCLFFSYVFKTKMPYLCPSFNKRFLMWACLLQVHAVCFLSYTLKYWLLVAFAWWAISWLLAQIDEQDETHTVFLFMVTHLYHF